MKKIYSLNNNIVLKKTPAVFKLQLVTAMLLACVGFNNKAFAIAPVATAASNLTCTSASANWVAVFGATQYFLDVSTTASFGTFEPGFNNLNVGNVITYNITGLSYNNYFYRLRADSAGSISLNSNTITFLLGDATLSSTLTPPPICSGSQFSYTPTSAGVGAIFSWTRAAVSGISNLAGSGTGDPAETLVNTTNSPINVTYFYTVTVNGCSNPFPNSVVVVVNPSPVVVITPSSQIICSGNITSFNLSSNLSGTSFSWTAVQTDVTGATSGSGSIIAQTLTATDTTNGTVLYTITPTANGCIGSSALLIVTVNINSVAPSSVTANPSSIFLGASTTLTATNGFLGSGAAYNWYTGSCGGTLVGTGNSINVSPSSTSSYFVRAIGTCNTTSCAAVTITVSIPVWPGDANNDSLVNNNDLLSVGLFYSQTGTPRASISNTWQANFSNNWGTLQPNGQDIKHADCNGDGTIDANDTLAINLNFNLIHAIVPAPHNDNEMRVASDMYFVFSGSNYNPGDWVYAELWLGTSLAPVSNLYGIAVNINYDASLVQTGTEMITYSPCWLGTPGTNALKVGKVDAPANKAYVALTRIDHTDVSGFGKIADFKFQIKTTLTSQAIFHLAVSDYVANNAAGLAQVFTAFTDSIAVNQSVGIQEANMASGLTIFPNPFSSQTTISFTKEMKNATVKIIDVLGKEVKNINFSGSQLIIPKGELNAGVYFVQVVSDKMLIANEKIIIQK